MRDFRDGSRHARSALLALWSVLLPGAALAADPAPSPTPVPYQEHIQVITSKEPETIRNTPAAVTVITRDDLALRGAYDLRSALRLVAGVDIAPGGDAGPASSIPEFRGLKEFDAFLLTVDGVPWGGAFNPALETLDLTDVDRIEVLRGAAPVTYGATSFVGVINVVRSSPADGGESLRAVGGSYGSGGLVWRKSLPSWAGMTSIVDLDLGREGFSDDRSEVQRGHLSWRNSRVVGAGTMHFALDSTLQRQDPASPRPRVGETLSSQVPVDSNENMRDAHIDEQRYTLQGGYERKALSGSWSTTLSVTRSRQDVLRGFLTDVTTTSPNGHGFREGIPVRDIYFDSHLSLSPGPRVQVIAGVDHLHGAGRGRGGDFDYDVGLDGSAAPSGSDLSSAARVAVTDRREFSGLYGQTIWTPAERWRFEAGARLNRTAESRATDNLDYASSVRDRSRDSRNVMRGSGFAGLAWTAWKKETDDLQLYANYRNTYKPAAIDFGLDANPEILAPETSTGYEGGLRSVLARGRLALELNAFQIDLQNLVVSQDVGGLPTLVNAGAERFRGIELETVLHPHRLLEWRTTYSLHDARFRDFLTEDGGVPTQLRGNRLEMSARNMASTEFVVGRSQGWVGSVRGGWVGSRFLDKPNSARTPAYFALDAGVGYRLQDVEIRLDGWNLGNQRPPISESELGDAQYYLLPARRIELSVRWTIGPGARH